MLECAQRERERDSTICPSANVAYEDKSLFMSHPIEVESRKCQFRPRNASTVDGTHITFNLGANHIETKDVTNTRPLLSGLYAT